MTTIEVPVETTPDPAAVEQYLGRLTAAMGGTLGLLLTSLGTRHGLWRALAGAGPCTAAQVAGRVTVDRALVREWLRGQAAAGYLDHDPAADTFELSPAAAAAIPDGPGSPLVRDPERPRTPPSTIISVCWRPRWATPRPPAST